MTEQQFLPHLFKLEHYACKFPLPEYDFDIDIFNSYNLLYLLFLVLYCMNVLNVCTKAAVPHVAARSHSLPVRIQSLMKHFYANVSQILTELHIQMFFHPINLELNKHDIVKTMNYPT